MKTWDDTFKGRHFHPEVILWAVRWYCRYPLAFRQVEEMLGERGVSLDHSTVARWVKQYGPEIERRLRKYPSHVSRSWRVDETCIKIKGQKAWLYRAVDKQGNSVDFMLSDTQDQEAAERFFKKSLKKPANSQPEKITTDQHLAYPAAITAMKSDKVLPDTVEHRKKKYLNNRIESDHARLKQRLKPMRGFKTFQSAACAIAGMEAMLMLKKRQFKAMTDYPTEVAFVHSLFHIAA